MKFFLASICCALGIASGSAQACPVAVQSFAAPSCGCAAQVQAFVQPQAVAVAQVHVVPQFVAVQQVHAFAPVCHSSVLALGHGCGSRVQVFGGHGRARVLGLGGRSVVRQRQVIRSR